MCKISLTFFDEEIPFLDVAVAWGNILHKLSFSSWLKSTSSAHSLSSFRPARQKVTLESPNRRLWNLHDNSWFTLTLTHMNGHTVKASTFPSIRFILSIDRIFLAAVDNVKRRRFFNGLTALFLLLKWCYIILISRFQKSVSLETSKISWCSPWLSCELL